MAIPEFIEVSYELLIWTEYTEQMNSLVEQLMPLGGFAWGTTWKFPTIIGDYTFDTTQADGEDRVVRATLPLITKATLLMPYELKKSNIQKNYSVKRISFKSEIETFDVNVSDNPPGGYPDNTRDNFDIILDSHDIRTENENHNQNKWASPVFHKSQQKINKL